IPIAAVMVSEAVYSALVAESEKIGVFAHGFTYSGHPVSSAVALETLKIYEERDILSRVRALAPKMQARVAELGGHAIVGEARGVGLVGAVELVADKATKRSFDPKAAVGPYVAKRAQEHGLIVRAIGDTIAVCPPLIITEAEIHMLFDRLKVALDETEAMARERGLI